MDFLLMGDPRIEDLPVRETGEPLIDLLEHFPELRFDSTRQYVQKVSPSITFGRTTLGRLLQDAQARLPAGVKLLIKECYRPLSVQRSFWVEHETFLRKIHPSWSDRNIRDECSKYIAPLTVAPHCTGGAVDLLLTDVDGNWLEMGCQFNAEPAACGYRTYFASEDISQQARQNRNILSDAMISVGFVNYPTEWWHWSYGDKYWAHHTGADFAIYSTIESVAQNDPSLILR